jgi:hypothetical protein
MKVTVKQHYGAALLTNEHGLTALVQNAADIEAILGADWGSGKYYIDDEYSALFPQAYVKFRFTSAYGATAGLVISADKLRALGVVEISRFFPHSEFMKMKRLEVSPAYGSELEAIKHEFKPNRGK